MLTREGPPARNGSPGANAQYQPAAARAEGAPVQARGHESQPMHDSQPPRGGSQAGSALPGPAGARAEGAAPARSVQTPPAPKPSTMPMKSAAPRAPAAGTAAPGNAAAKSAPAHTEIAKSGKPDAKKDGQGKDAKPKHEGQ